ncbi:MAG: lamin tail domain-containing protein [Bacteroides sp.]
MRRIIITIAFLWSICSYSQVNEDFSDNNTTINPAWHGDSDKFIIKSQELQLNDLAPNKGENTAYLSTSSSLIKETSWQCHVNLYENPSANYYAKFYLTSSSAKLNQSLRGYYVMIGGKGNNVSFYRQEGEETKLLIEGRPAMDKVNHPMLDIKVTCDKNGNWVLYTCFLNKDDDFVKEGSILDTTIGESAYSGIVCVYTVSRNKAFGFDDIFVSSLEAPVDPDKPDPDDSTPPKLLSFASNSDTTILLNFDEPIDISKTYFLVEHIYQPKQLQLSTNKKSLTLVMPFHFENKKAYYLSINGVKDLTGNRLNSTEINFTFYDTSSQSIDFGGLVFNEIMANPMGANNLPETEYIELYNRTNYPINLNEWRLHYGKKTYKLPPLLLLAKGYTILSADKMSFPALSNAGKLLYLEDEKGKLIAWTEYSSKWYRDEFKKKGGFSLECIDASNFANEAANWIESKDKRGGTPNEQNSVIDKFPDRSIAEITYSYLSSPDTLIINFSKPMQLVGLANTDSYRMNESISVLAAIPNYPKGMSVKIALSDSLRIDQTLHMELKQLKDISGFDLEGNLTVEAGIAQEAKVGEVLFNEVLFDPRTGGSDYVELYNNSDNYIALHRLFFSSYNEEGKLTEGIMLSDSSRTFSPHSYLCFTTDASAICQQYTCSTHSIIECGKLPSLPDDKGNILLISPTEEPIDRFIYTDKMHSALLHNKEGISLEKYYPSESSASANNWLSASSQCGGGTPGKENSQYREPSTTSKEDFVLSKKSFSPDGDGVDDELVINYCLNENNYVMDVKVYDTSGQFIRTLADNYRLATQGSLIWNGTDTNEHLCRVGLYIIYIEAHNPNGNVKHYKLACALSQ